MRSLNSALLFAAILSLSFADVYMHNPRGSNDRNCERNVNRDNANRLFDSQNNAKGGYACPRAVGSTTPNHQDETDKFYYYVGSKLRVEWTNQHGCGTNPKTECDIILQYMCGEELRDGVPEGVRDAATTTIPDDPVKYKQPNFGMHEDYDYYQKCKTRQRNLGIYTADRKLNKKDARSTRQNNNGERHGFECPEERDYYPYWHPTPWKDIAIITDDGSRCPYYQAESQNVKEKWQCVGTLPSAENLRKVKWTGGQNIHPKYEWDCKLLNMTWEKTPAWGIGAPSCNVQTGRPGTKSHYYSRSNHLGNVQFDGRTFLPEPETDHYNWTIPNDVQGNCVIRLRYNISTTDFPQRPPGPFINASWNGELAPVKQDPYIKLDQNKYLSLAINTNQYGRTFQDRSYAFSIKTAPQSAQGKTIWNLNVRGKRGNIVQTYPAVEYDFVPSILLVEPNDLVHFQWTGSDYNPQRGCNNGEGGPPDLADANPKENPRADRSNIIEVEEFAMGKNKNMTQIPEQTMLVTANGQADMETIMKLAYLGQKDCMDMEQLKAIQNRDEREFTRRNCFKLNSRPQPYFDGGLVQMRKQGIMKYMSSRNNNFSNRDQKGLIVVGSSQTSTPGRIESAAFLMGAEGDGPTAPPPANAANNDDIGDGIKLPCGSKIYNGYSEAETGGIAFGAVLLGVGMGAVAGAFMIKKGIILDGGAAVL